MHSIASEAPLAVCSVDVLPDKKRRLLSLYKRAIKEECTFSNKFRVISLSDLQGIRFTGKHLVVITSPWKRVYGDVDGGLEGFYECLLGAERKVKTGILSINLRTASNNELSEASIQLARALEARLKASQTIAEEAETTLRRYKEEARQLFGKDLAELLNDPVGNQWAEERLTALKNMLIPQEVITSVLLEHNLTQSPRTASSRVSSTPG
eukprot:TRINITY_DN4786_c1_g3_i2.p1 TRINITY_DN4786_c1_g3~~TRINITY_DN4786_c1_g3_i2.p1  ORF type:complete len:237 (+),score=23.76 TRINITY_DN4786_c1_g3_i2:83-712(+)